MRERFWEAWQSGKARPEDDVQMDESQWTVFVPEKYAIRHIFRIFILIRSIYIYINVHRHSIHFDSFNIQHSSFNIQKLPAQMGPQEFN